MSQHPSSARLHRFFRRVAMAEPYALLLGGGNEPSALNRWNIIGVGLRQSIFLNGDILTVNGQAHALGELEPSAASAFLFEQLELARRQAFSWEEPDNDRGLPMLGGLAGALGYGFYRWCDTVWQALPPPMPQSDEASPDLLLFEFEDWLFVPTDSSELIVLSRSEERKSHYLALWRTLASEGTDVSREHLLTSLRIEDLAGDLSEAELAEYGRRFQCSFDAETFETAVDALKREIREGALYQANLSLRLRRTMLVNPFELFERLCQRNPSPFSGFLQWPGHIIVSNSPERLIQVDKDGQARTRPIAGTRGRGKTPDEEARIGRTLLENEKELAEHRMLIDLARNDLGRVCQTGTVRVDDLLALERYSHVTHLVSNVTGALRPDAGPWDAIRALFPGGTITGCPKVRCVRLLHGVEPAPRGFYTGSMGYIDARRPSMDWNILIRSLFLREVDADFTYNVDVHVGAGIVHDAVGAYEYRECLRKASASLNVLHSLDPCSEPVSSVTRSLEERNP